MENAFCGVKVDYKIEKGEVTYPAGRSPAFSADRLPLTESPEQAIKWMPFWHGYEVMNITFCHALLRSYELYCLFDQSGVATLPTASRHQGGGPSNLTIDIYDLTEK